MNELNENKINKQETETAETHRMPNCISVLRHFGLKKSFSH